MEFNQVSQDEFVDLFGQGSTESQPKTFNIQQTEEDVDILGAEKSQESQKPTVEGSEVDLLGEIDETKQKVGRKPKYDFSDMSGYFQDRFKNNKLIPIVGEDDKPVELKTPEDFDMVIEENINYQVQQKQKELEQNWYQTKSPAWKAVAQYAEYVQDPSELLPFLQGVQNIQSVASVDEKTVEGAEQIVRYQKQLAGTPPDVIEEEIEALKSTDKLVSSATKIKPTILAREEQRLAQMQEEARMNEINYWTMVQSYEQKARQTIDKPLFGKIKLPNEEKAEIYDLIAIPNEQSGGYQIYNEIDSLYENGDFETLREIALLLKKKEKYIKYASQDEVEKVGREVQQKLRLATQPASTSTGLEDPIYDDRPVIKKYKPFNSKG